MGTITRTLTIKKQGETMLAQTSITDQWTGTLVSTTDNALASKLQHRMSLASITNGRPARFERDGNTITLFIGGNLYELSE
jgi:hypothetical protein